MDTFRIYKYSLVLPLVFPILAALLLYISVELFPAPQTYEQVSRWHDGLNLVLGIVAGSGLIGGIPYLVLAGLLLLEMKRMNEHQVRMSLAWLPVLMVIFFGLILAVLAPFSGGFDANSLSRFFMQWLAFSVFTLVFGYCYVLLTFLLVRLLRRHWPEWRKV